MAFTRKGKTAANNTLAPSAPSAVTAIEVEATLQQLADMLNNMLATADTARKVADAHDAARKVEDVAKQFAKAFRNKCLEAILAHGTRVTEKGTLELDLGNGLAQQAIPTKTGIDPEKLEGLLRAKGWVPERAMDPEISYKVNADKVAGLVHSGRITQGEREAIEYDLVYRVTKVQPLKGKAVFTGVRPSEMNAGEAQTPNEEQNNE